MSACSNPPVLLILDFNGGVIYHCEQCGEKLSPTEAERFVTQFIDGKLTPTG